MVRRWQNAVIGDATSGYRNSDRDWLFEAADIHSGELLIGAPLEATRVASYSFTHLGGGFMTGRPRSTEGAPSRASRSVLSTAEWSPVEPFTSVIVRSAQSIGGGTCGGSRSSEPYSRRLAALPRDPLLARLRRPQPCKVQVGSTTWQISGAPFTAGKAYGIPSCCTTNQLRPAEGLERPESHGQPRSFGVIETGGKRPAWAAPPRRSHASSTCVIAATTVPRRLHCAQCRLSSSGVGRCERGLADRAVYDERSPPVCVRVDTGR
jgi:hypothetical protein